MATKSVAEHYENTIIKLVVFEDHKDLLDSDALQELNRLFPSGSARFWGVVPGRQNTAKYATLRQGDGVALYGQRQLYAAGRIAVLFRNRELAERLWEVDAEGRTWELMYAMTDFHDVEVPILLVQQVMGWKSTAVVQGFTVADEKQAEDLAALCGLDLEVPLTPEGTPPPVLTPAEQDVEEDRAEGAEWLADNPSDVDTLKRHSLARVLATRLQRVQADSPGESFFLHIDGPWGAGKSTLLSLLKQELENTFVVVEYDAWRNAHIDPPWWALLTTLRDSVGRAFPLWRRPLLRLREAAARIRRAGAPYVLGVLFLIPVVLGIGAALFWGIDILSQQFTDSTKVADTASKWVQMGVAAAGLLGSLVAGAMVLSRFLLWNSAKGARVLEQANTDPMHEVAAHFAWLLRRSPKPVVFFIDDLDRCDEKSVVALLEAAQTLIRTAPSRGRRQRAALHTVVAADGAWIRQAYEVAYEKFATAIEEPGRPLGYLFLDKLFQLRVPLPSIGLANQSDFFRTLLGRTDPDNDVAEEIKDLRQEVNASESEADLLKALQGASQAAREQVASEAVTKLSQRRLATDTEHALEQFAQLLNANPRSMKRFINCYTVVRAVRTLEGNIVPTEALAMWVLLQIRWPLFADYLQEHPDAIEYVGQDPLPEGLPEPIQNLMRSAALQQVLKTAPTPLSPVLIRMSCGEPVEESG
ncbi:KAP family P-loop NTPase fold protein [Nonomuraea angiospora]|uniref:KAP family P-loop NTPase fold protein n=1 Tax=Nonomuraea angiospora TaxID=46172 RepID=UPI0029AB0705|nr:P-loop NTPase fold protein [Nonomuraea angiospora]MDX3108942.1 P-loop NTPase fold protein [Nonomuraea angiospora]